MQFAFPLVGAALLFAGFAMQLSGYVVEFHDDWLVVAAICVSIGSVLVGLVLVGLVSTWLLRQARLHDPTLTRSTG
jgi:NhaP-type Na+/H+ or K+/H+ antiporter